MSMYKKKEKKKEKKKTKEIKANTLRVLELLALRVTQHRIAVCHIS